MERHKRYFARTLVLASALIGAIALGLLIPVILGQPQSPRTGIDLSLLAKARAGDASAETTLAYAYLKGEGLPQDFEQAAFWYAKAANQGDAKAQYNLGLMYHNGHGVRQDDAQAVLWLTKAANQGIVKAQLHLWWLYENGIGVPKDNTQAVFWLQKAADQGDAEAQFTLGWHYQHYWGADQDHAQSVVWYRKAADQGFAKAQFELGKMYYDGDVVPQDMALAEMWVRRAADQGDSDAQKLLSILVAGDEHRREDLKLHILVTICFAVLVSLASVLFRNREKLISHMSKHIPRTSRAKQLAVVLLVASWCSASCLYQLFDPWMLRHPIDAVATALLFSAPAVIFGAVYLWWLSMSNKGN